MDRSFWPKWAQTLQRLNLRGISLVILDGSGPLKLILAQIMLAGSPFVSTTSRSQWEAAAEMLEDRDESQTFAEFLRGEKAS